MVKHCFNSLVRTVHIVSNPVKHGAHCFKYGIDRGGKHPPPKEVNVNQIVINGHIVDLDTCQRIATRHNVDGNDFFTDHLLRAGAGKYILNKIRPLTRTEIKYILLDNNYLLAWLNGLPTHYMDTQPLIDDGIIKPLNKIVPAPTHSPTFPPSGGGGECETMETIQE